MTGLSEIAAAGTEVTRVLLDPVPAADRDATLAELDALAALCDRDMVRRPYYAVSPALRDRWNDALPRFGAEPHRLGALMLARLIARSASRTNRSIPASIVPEVVEQFGRILRRVTGRSTRDLRLEDDVYLKDLALCRLEALPCAVQIIERGAGIPRRLLVDGGVGQAARLLALAAGNGRAWRPYLEMHLHTPMLRSFSPEGWRKCYLMVADILRAEPEWLGILGGSWFYDPAVEEFSPNLAYLRREPLAGGASFFRRHTTDEDVHNATATPEPRRQAYLDGRYKPSGWSIVWPRGALLAWADKTVSAGAS